jgi:hypothetical protein
VGILDFGSEITFSYALGNVTGEHYTGGLIGDQHNGSLNRTFSSGAVTGQAYTGGLTGLFDGYDNENNYWDVERSGQTYSAVGIGKTTYEMYQRNTYAEWDFVNVWGIDNGNDYPKLKYLDE